MMFICRAEEDKKETNMERASFFSLKLQMPKDEPHQNPELRTQSMSPTWETGSKLGHNLMRCRACVSKKLKFVVDPTLNSSSTTWVASES